MQHDIGKYLRVPLAEHRARFSRIDTIIRSFFFLFRRDGLLVFFFPRPLYETMGTELDYDNELTKIWWESDSLPQSLNLIQGVESG